MTTPGDGGMRTAYPFDADPLVQPVDDRAVREFARRLRAEGRVASVFSSPQAIVGLVVGGIAVLIVGSSALSIFVGVFAALAQNGSGAFSLVAIVPVLFFAGVIALATVLTVRSLRGGSERWYRLDRFARANGMTYVPQFGSPGLPGMIFSQGRSRRSTDLVRGERPRFVEFANYRYVTGSGKNQTTHKWGYVAVKLDVPLPHIVLDATGNNGLFGSNLPLAFDRDQRFGLEGDFDRYFSLYCPAGYERDALYLFTPDIMARFIDNAAALDVEIVDDWLFLYAKRDFSTLDPATWAWLFSVVGALLDKLAQWARWRDERLADGTVHAAHAAAAASALPGSGPSAPAATAVPFSVPAAALRPPPGVAAPGRRLRRGVPWAAIIVFGVIGLFWLIGQTGFLGLFFR
ncbi:hypothetical protein QSU92_09425 [Microbacterium sp. ET2]|uniref:hypothetical protein n=1 Tax=Microbacterium albipurpureum TaxID=3050384 RepID=UPI00259CF316|nr:hypothetical protein [Microbacterium sp. ET2 (Ac-2212)]WJL94219.1 hypothetical protein QSU92_09425 [Microbacterium sp. ET2 (Ac-2212)]